MIVKICKIHGDLKENQTIINRISPKGKKYLRCRKCRNESEKNRKNKTIYGTIIRRKYKYLPDFIKDDEQRNHAYTILNRFKVTATEYYDLLEKQKNVCAICKKSERQIKRKSKNIKRLSVDHCHISGKVRGLLCHHCNVALGSFQDSIKYLEAAIDYIKANHN